MDDDGIPPVYEIQEKPEVPGYVDALSKFMATVLLIALFVLVLVILGKLGYELIT